MQPGGRPDQPWWRNSLDALAKFYRRWKFPESENGRIKCGILRHVNAPDPGSIPRRLQESAQAALLRLAALSADVLYHDKSHAMADISPIPQKPTRTCRASPADASIRIK